MNLERINSILNNKEKCDVFYDNRAVWIQGISNTTAKVGFIVILKKKMSKFKIYMNKLEFIKIFSI